MTWTAPMTFVSGRPVTASQLNVHLRDNLMEQAVAKATVAGSYFVTEARHRIAQRRLASSRVDTSESTTSTTYTDLTTLGPSVTVTTGQFALVLFSCQVSPNPGPTKGYMSFEVTGASSRPASDEYSIQGEIPNNLALGQADLITDLTPGSNTFTAKYRIPGGNSEQFTWRNLIVWPM